VDSGVRWSLRTGIVLRLSPGRLAVWVSGSCLESGRVETLVVEIEA